jgi:hypothetical protein
MKAYIILKLVSQWTQQTTQNSSDVSVTNSKRYSLLLYKDSVCIIVSVVRASPRFLPIYFLPNEYTFYRTCVLYWSGI